MIVNAGYEFSIKFCTLNLQFGLKEKKKRTTVLKRYFTTQWNFGNMSVLYIIPTCVLY